MVFQEIGKARAETRKNVFFIYSVIMATLQIVLLCLIPAAVREENLRSRVVSYVYAFSYLVATTTYSIIIYKLWQTLKRMKEFGSDFSEQHRDIMRQF